MSSKICYEWLNRLQCAGVPFLCDLTTAKVSAPRFRKRLLKLRDQYRDNEAAAPVFEDIEQWEGGPRNLYSTTMLGVAVTNLDDIHDDSPQGLESGLDDLQEGPEDSCEEDMTQVD